MVKGDTYATNAGEKVFVNMENKRQRVKTVKEVVYAAMENLSIGAKNVKEVGYANTIKLEQHAENARVALIVPIIS